MKVTIKDIAKACGVSKATVSRYMNGSGYVSKEAANNIKAAIKEMNYVPSATARSLSTRKSKVIGVVVPEADNPFYGEIFRGISEVAEKNELSIIYFDTNNNKNKEFKALAMLRSHDICGLIVTPSQGDKDKKYSEVFIELVEELKVPVVLFDRKITDANWPGVYTEDVMGALKGTRLLIQNGHRKIATITGDQDLLLGENRHKGFLKAVEEAKIKEENIRVMEGDFTTDTAYRKTLELLELDERPTGIFSPNNLTTIGMLKALFEKGLKIPEDMAVVAFDDIQILNDLHIPITVIKRDTIDLGRKCMELLNKQMESLTPEWDEKKEVEEIIVQPELVLRGSEKLSS